MGAGTISIEEVNIDELGQQKNVIPEIKVTPDDLEDYQFSFENFRNNLLPSMGQLYKDVAHMVTNPVETFGALKDLSVGIAQHGMNESGFKTYETPTDEMKISSAAYDYMKQRYGGVNNLLRTLETDPAGFLTDAMVVFGGAGFTAMKAGSGLSKITGLTKAGGTISKAGQTISNVAKYGDPLYFGLQAPIKNTAKYGAATLSGIPVVAYEQAINMGNRASQAYKDAMRGVDTPESIVTDIKSGIKDARSLAGKEYGARMSDLDLSSSIDYQPIKDLYKQQKKDLTKLSGTTSTYLTKSDSQKLNELGRIIDKYIKRKPKINRTLEGADFMRKEINAKFPENASKPVQSVWTQTKQKLINEIDSSASGYRNVQKGHEKALNIIGDIEKSLSAGDKAQVQTGINKILSIAKNAGSKQYQLDLLNELYRRTGIDVVGSAAGLSFKDPVSYRGLTAGGISGVGAGASPLMYGGMFDPVIAGGATALLGIGGSPRLGGELSYLLGQSTRIPGVGNRGINRALYGSLLGQELATAPYEGKFNIDDIDPTNILGIL